MKRLIWALLIGSCLAQTTPNLHLNIPAQGTPNWDVLLNQNFSTLDQYVGTTVSATHFAGADIGAQINAAYASASCSSRGCRIHVNAAASCYLFSTPIVFSTVDKPALIEGDPGGATCIQYTPITGTAITLDYGVHEKAAQGIRDLQIIGPGPGTSTVGIQVGGTNGAEGSVISGVKFGTNCCSSDGFGKNIAYNANGAGFATTIQDSFIQGGGTGIDIPGNAENIRIVNSIISRNVTGLNIAANVADVHVYGTSFDENITAAVSVIGGITNPEPVFSCVACHFENLSSGTGQYITASNATVFLYGGAIYDDRTVGTNAQFISASGTSYITALGTSLNSGGITVTQAVNFSGTSRGFLNFITTPVAITSEYNTAYTSAPVINIPLRGTSLTPLSASATGWLASSSIPFILSAGVGLNNYSLIAANPVTARNLTINDPGGNDTFLFSAATQTLSNKSTAAGPLAGTVASGTSTLTSGAVTTNTCQTAVTTAATGTAATDAIEWSYATAPGTADAVMHVSPYPTANNVNFTRCNATSASQTGTAIVINWRVSR